MDSTKPAAIPKCKQLKREVYALSWHTESITKIRLHAVFRSPYFRFKCYFRSFITLRTDYRWQGQKELYMTLPEEHISSDSFEVINTTKPPNFWRAEAERNCTIEDSPVGTFTNSPINSNSQAKANQYM